MAFSQIYVHRACPQESFPYLEEEIIPCVGQVVYGDRYPGEEAVSAATMHGTLGTFMELEVKVDTVDLPRSGWLISNSGLCVPGDSETTAGEIVGKVSSNGLTEHQLYRHHAVQARQITEAVTAHPLWSDIIGWRGQLPPNKKLGTLVVKAQGPWHATNS